MSTLRSWATPVTVGTFLIMGTTGVLMFFHIETGLNGFVHEWAGWLLLIGVGAHLLMNWRAFKTYFKRPLAKGIMGMGALVLAVSFLPVEDEGGNPMKLVREAIQIAPIEQVIALSGQDVETGLAALDAAGIIVLPGQSLGIVTAGDRAKEMQAVKILFGD